MKKLGKKWTNRRKKWGKNEKWRKNWKKRQIGQKNRKTDKMDK